MELITIVWIDPECSWSFTVEYTSWILGVQNKPTDQVWENDEKSFHFFVFQICSFTLWCLYMIIHVCSSSRRKIKGNEYKLRTIRTLSCPVSCIFMNKPKQKYNQATNKMEKDEINWIALLQLRSRDFKNWIENRIQSCKCQNGYSAA